MVLVSIVNEKLVLFGCIHTCYAGLAAFSIQAYRKITLGDLSTGIEQESLQHSLIIQNDISNESSPITIVAPITSRIYTKDFPTNVFVPKAVSRLDRDSNVLLNQIRAIDKLRIRKRISSLDVNLMKKVDRAIKVSLGLSG